MEEGGGGDGGKGDAPATININPDTIKVAQEEMGRLDVLVCGECHTVFHFVEDFQNHRSKEGACSKTSNFRENSNNDQKAQVWAFLLWKGTQTNPESPDKDSASWNLYQKWCQMDAYIRDGWITAGKTIQTFTKISNTKMQDAPLQQGSIITEGGKTVVVRKVIRNGQSGSPDKKSSIKVKSEPGDLKKKIKLRPANLPKEKLNELDENHAASGGEEYELEKILAKRFNPKKKVYEYLLKWEGFNHEHNTWEEVSVVSLIYKQQIDEFEKNLAKQKLIKAQQVAKTGGIMKSNKSDGKAGSSSSSQAGRPMRSSKSKAMDQVKQWCGSLDDEENEMAIGKRKINFSDSESDEDGIGAIKRSKIDTSGDDDWTADSEDDKVIIGRSDVIQRAFSRANAQSNGANRPMTAHEITNSVIANKGVFKANAQAASNVYIVHKKEGIIKLDSSPTNKISVKGPNTSTIMVQNRDGNIVRKQVIGTHSNSITPVKVVSKPDGTQVVTQMKVVPKSSPINKTGAVLAKNKPIKIQPKPDPNQTQQLHLVTAIPNQMQAQRLTTPTAVRSPGQRTADGRPLLPRPTTTVVRTTTPTSTAVIGTKTAVRTPVQRQVVQQKRNTPTSTIVQVSSSPGAVSTVQRPKITVMNQQGKMVQKTVIGPNQAARPVNKMSPAGRIPSTVATPQQKMLAAKRKIGMEAGIIPKPPGSRNTAANAANKGAVRAKAVSTASTANKPKESKLAATDGLHMEFHEVESEESSSEDEPNFPPLPTEASQPAESESPPRLTLCPLTGRIIGPDGQPIEQPEPEPEPAPTPTPMAIVQVSTGGATINVDGTITTGGAGQTAELVLPNLEGLADSTGGIVRVEMSPGGTTGTIVQTSESMTINMPNVVVPGPDLPCLDDSDDQPATSSDIVVSVAPEIVADTTAATSSTNEPATIASGAVTTTTVTVAPSVPTSTAEVTTTEATSAEQTENVIIPTLTKEDVPTSSEAMNVKMEENNGVVTITGEDGVLYQVAGHAEDGQTLLVTRADDGEQQCVYVTTSDAQPTEEGSVLTLDQAVAQLMPDQVNVAPQFYVKEGATEGTEATPTENQQVVMSIMDNSSMAAATPEEGENQAQVVAQVIQADEPTPGGTRRVVLLLPDGNLMMTEVDEEQYAALELDK